jgi:hypothetical protein
VPQIKPYPSNITDDVSSVSATLRFICRMRLEDITELNRLQSSFMKGRRVYKVPTSSIDVAADDRLGDFNLTKDYVYFCIDNAGTTEWRRASLGSW